jgi:TatD DNase family protein
MLFIDSHCHLNLPLFDEDRHEVLKRASAEGIKIILLISTGVEDASALEGMVHHFEEIVLQEKEIPTLYYSVGIHPDACTVSQENLSSFLLKAGAASKAIAFGETGLDYYHESFQKNFQQEAFEAHLHAACLMDLPVVVHSRSAEEDTIEMLKKFPEARGVIHCFTGSKEMAKKCLDLGFYISFSGIVTFKNATALQEIASFVPLDRMLIETDAPFLAPVPHRGKRNEPAFLRHTLDFIAHTKGINAETLAMETTENFFTLFNKAQPLMERISAEDLKK